MKQMKLDRVEIAMLNALAKEPIFLTFKELAFAAKVHVTTAGWYLRRMEEAGLVKTERAQLEKRNFLFDTWPPTEIQPDSLSYRLGDNPDIPSLLATAALDKME